MHETRISKGRQELNNAFTLLLTHVFATPIVPYRKHLAIKACFEAALHLSFVQVNELFISTLYTPEQKVYEPFILHNKLKRLNKITNQ